MSLLTGDAIKSGIAGATTASNTIPRITIQAFCDTAQTAQLLESTVHDRRMAKVALTTHNGGIAGAIETYKHNPTPNLIIVETALDLEALLPALARLAQSCDATARIVVLGHLNDVRLYRELLRAGIADYIVLPAVAAQIVTSIVELFATTETQIGRTIGFVSAKGGQAARPWRTISAGPPRRCSTRTASSSTWIWPSARQGSTSTRIPPRALPKPWHSSPAISLSSTG